MINICGVVGVLLSIGSLIVIAIGAALPHFVDVYIVRIASEADHEPAVGGIGVFSSEYDGSVLSPEVLAASGVPAGKFDTKTLDFPLLFPAQKNFVADVLPLDDETAIALDVALGANGAISDPLVTEINNIDDLEFDNCDNYINTQFSNLEALFNTLQSETLPAAFLGISVETAQSFDNASIGVFGVFCTATGANSTNANFGVVANLGTFGQLLGQCASPDTADPDDSIKQCYAGVLINTLPALGLLGPVSSFAVVQFGEYLNSSSVTGLSVNDVLFGTIAYQLNPTVTLADAASFVDVTAATQKLACQFFPPIGEFPQCSVIGYMAASATMWLELDFINSDLELAATATGAYIAAIDVGLLLNTSSIADNAGAAQTGNGLAASTVNAGPQAFPASFASAYNANCLFIQAFQAAANVSLGVPAQGNCEFREYIAALPLFLAANQNDLASTVEEVSGLYAQCDAGVGGIVQLCPLVFTFALLDGAYGGDIGIESDGSDFADSGAAFIARGIDQCEDDNTDHDKIAQAQVMIIVGYVFYALALLVGIGSIVASNPYLFGVAGVSGVLAGILIIGALLVVQSAPVYANVGVDPVIPPGETVDDLPFVPFYKQGEVAIMAIVAAVAEIVAGITFFAAACVAAKSSSPAGEMKEEKADVDVEKEEKTEKKAVEAEPVAEEVKAEEDVVPGTNVSI